MKLEEAGRVLRAEGGRGGGQVKHRGGILGEERTYTKVQEEINDYVF